MADTEREEFEAWARDPIRAEKLPLDRWPTNDGYKDTRAYIAFYGWKSARAALASRPAEVDDEGLPDLPGSNFCAWVQHGKVWNAFPHGVGDKSIWDSNRYWTERGFDREPLFTAEQYRQGQRDAVAADRARRGASGK